MDIYHQQKKTLKETVERLLTNKCKGLWHLLHMDNYYNSVELSEALLAQKIHMLTSEQCDVRGDPTKIWNSQNLVRHNIIARSNEKVTVLAWKDKRIVKAITMKHDNSMVSVTRRKKGGHGEREQIQTPVCVCDYNKHMPGVDHVDQIILYYPSTRNTLMWTKKLFFYFMEISVSKAYVLYQAKSSMTLYDFHLKLISKMCRKCLKCEDTLSSEDEGGSLPKSPRYPPPSRLHGGFKHH